MNHRSFTVNFANVWSSNYLIANVILDSEMKDPSVILFQFSQILKKYLYLKFRVLKITVLRIRCYGD